MNFICSIVLLLSLLIFTSESICGIKGKEKTITKQTKKNFEKKIIPVNDSLFLKLFNNPSKKIFLHFFGTWCESQRIGFREVIKQQNKLSNIKFVLILTDICTQQNIEHLETYFRKLTNQQILIYNVNNDLSDENIQIFVEEKPLKIFKLIKQIDSSYKSLSLPFSCLIDTSGYLINKLHPLMLITNDNDKPKISRLKTIYKKKLKEFLNTLK